LGTHAFIGFTIETDVHYGLRYEMTKLPIVQYPVADLVGVQLPHLEQRGVLVLTKLQEHLGEFATTGSFDLVPIRSFVGDKERVYLIYSCCDGVEQWFS
jgi:hypothetical protein